MSKNYDEVNEHMKKTLKNLQIIKAARDSNEEIKKYQDEIKRLNDLNEHNLATIKDLKDQLNNHPDVVKFLNSSHIR